MRSQLLEKLTMKTAESEERLRGMRILKKKGIGFNYIEDFLQNSAKMGKSDPNQGKEESDIVNLLMTKKVRDAKKVLKNLKRQQRELKCSFKNKKGKRNKNQSPQSGRNSVINPCLCVWHPMLICLSTDSYSIKSK